MRLRDGQGGGAQGGAQEARRLRTAFVQLVCLSQITSRNLAYDPLPFLGIECPHGERGHIGRERHAAGNLTGWDPSACPSAGFWNRTGSPGLV